MQGTSGLDGLASAESVDELRRGNPLKSVVRAALSTLASQATEAEYDSLGREIAGQLAADRLLVTQLQTQDANPKHLTLAQMLGRFCTILTEDRDVDAMTLLGFLRAEGLSDTQIADTVVPAAARQLGTDWMEDRRSFFDVSVGSMRLQSMIRMLDELMPVPTDPVDAKPISCLMVVPWGEDHTLGAATAAMLLRRMGADVQLVVGRRPSEILELVEKTRADRVLFSAPRKESLAAIEEMILRISRLSCARPLTVLGGSVIGRESNSVPGVSADIVTDDLRVAIAPVEHRPPSSS